VCFARRDTRHITFKDCFHTLRAGGGRCEGAWRVWKRSVVLSRYAVGGAMEFEAPSTSTEGDRWV